MLTPVSAQWSAVSAAHNRPQTGPTIYRGKRFFVLSGSSLEIIARGSGVRDRHRLNRVYGKGTWRKLKGFATIRYDNGHTQKAEIHWYEANGIGKREFKVKD